MIQVLCDYDTMSTCMILTHFFRILSADDSAPIQDAPAPPKKPEGKAPARYGSFASEAKQRWMALAHGNAVGPSISGRRNYWKK